jgi:hypothetical protein
MIFNIFYLFVTGLVSIVTVLFPPADPAVIAQVQAGFTPIRTLLTTVNNIMPVNLFLTAIGIMLSTELILLTVRGVMWFLHMITLKFIPKL